jgi:hypothetical protein
MQAVTPRRIVASAIWHRETVLPAAPALVRLEELLPEPGEEQIVRVSGYEVCADATLDLLWCPPYSEQNGWDGQPSEIESSHIITGRVRRKQPAGATQSKARSSDTDEVPCEILIEERVPLLGCVRTLLQAPSMAALSMPSRVKYEHWRQAHWCGAAEIGGFIYLSVAAGEANLDLILRRHGKALTAHYEQLCFDGWYHAAIGYWELERTALEIFEKHLSNAVELRDQATPYLE